jgi:polysaccharide pyruvyl transferase WcaK-like protein
MTNSRCPSEDSFDKRVAVIGGTPLVKMSQALGPFRSLANRTAARIVLPQAHRVFARGKETESHLASLGLRNVSPAADLAFILNDRVPLPDVPAGVLPDGEAEGTLIGVCPSEVLDRACAARGTDLAGVLAAALDALVEETGGRVAIVAHSLLEPEKSSHTNDYRICVRVRDRMARSDRASLVLADLSPSELRAVISRCDCLVAARFHSMISALCVGVPPVVLAWSHKYREVMSDFGLERFVIEREEISAARIVEGVRAALAERESIRRLIGNAFDAVAASARSQIDDAAGLLSKTRARKGAGAVARRLYARFYENIFLSARIGYASDPAVRARAASGGLVTALLAEEKIGRAHV